MCLNCPLVIQSSKARVKTKSFDCKRKPEYPEKTFHTEKSPPGMDSHQGPSGCKAAVLTVYHRKHTCKSKKCDVQGNREAHFTWIMWRKLQKKKKAKWSLSVGFKMADLGRKVVHIRRKLLIWAEDGH